MRLNERIAHIRQAVSDYPTTSVPARAVRGDQFPLRRGGVLWRAALGDASRRGRGRAGGDSRAHYRGGTGCILGAAFGDGRTWQLGAHRHRRAYASRNEEAFLLVLWASGETAERDGRHGRMWRDDQCRQYGLYIGERLVGTSPPLCDLHRPVGGRGSSGIFQGGREADEDVVLETPIRVHREILSGKILGN